MGVTAKVVIYETFIEGRLEAPEHLTHSVHDLYFEPKYEEFRLMIRTQHTNPSMRNAVISTVTPMPSTGNLNTLTDVPDHHLPAGEGGERGK